MRPLFRCAALALLFALGLGSACRRPAPPESEARPAFIGLSDTSLFLPADHLSGPWRSRANPVLARYARTGAMADSARTLLRYMLWGVANAENSLLAIDSVSGARCFESTDSVFLFALSHPHCPTMTEVPCRLWVLLDQNGRWVQSFEAESVRLLPWTKTERDTLRTTETLLLAVRRAPEETELLSFNRQGLFNLLDPMSEQKPVWLDDVSDPCAYEPVQLKAVFEDLNGDGYPDLRAMGEKSCDGRRSPVSHRWRYLPQKRFFVAGN